MNVVYTRPALYDLNDLYEFFAAQDPKIAQDVEDLIRTSLQLLSEFLEIGVPTDVVNVRRLPMVWYPVMAFYRLSTRTDQVEFLRVLHARHVQDLDRPS